MKRLLRDKRSYSILAWISVLIIILGFVMVSRVFDRYDVLVKENVDSQLLRLARSVDRSVESSLGRYEDNLIHTTNHEDVWAAAKLWQKNGDAQPWIERMENSQLKESEGFSAVLLMQGEKVVASTKKDGNYFFPKQEKDFREINLRPCLDDQGTVYLAFMRETERGFQYAALVELREFYEKAAGNIVLQSENQIMLMDRYGQMFIHKKNDSVHIDRMSKVDESNCEYSVIRFMEAQQKLGETETLLYEGTSHTTGERYSARMAAIPATSESNGYFAVGVSINYDKQTMPLKMMAVRMMAAGSILVLGIVVLLLLLFETLQKNQRTLKEIETLQEKNAAMEELNRKTQNLAHHQRLEIMGMLTSGIAHEFNNMLTPIMGYSMMILEKLPEDDTELYDEVLEIYQMSAKAKTVISRLSDLSRKNASTAFKEISLDELVRRMISAAKSARPNDVDVQLELKCPEVIMVGNETQLSQLLLNLILNSYHALEEKGGTLEILTHMEGTNICLEVRDNGCGIAQEHLPHIFDPFFTTKEAGKGTGLGMAIVAQVVEEHQGKIHVKSVVNEGTSIFINFPTKS